MSKLLLARRTAAAVLLALLIACAPARTEASAAPGGPVLIRNVTVIDGSGAPPVPARDVLISGGRIAAVAPPGLSGAPADAERIDGTGKFLIPGLIDSHVHLHTRRRDPGMIEEILGLVLRGGVTTIRDMGGNGAALAPLAERARDPAVDSPDILLSTLVTGPASPFWMSGEVGDYVAAGTAHGRSPWFRRLERAEDIPGLVAEARRFGARGLKVHSGMAVELLRPLADQARGAGLAIWSHSRIGPATPGDAVDAGVTILSHADSLAYEGVSLADLGSSTNYVERTRRAMRATPVGGPALGRLFEAMRARRACLEPTLMVMGADNPSPHMADYYAYSAAVTKRAHDMGVPICAGTDAIGGSTPNLPTELALFVRLIGLTPLEAIRAATSTNAAALGLTDRGLVRPGLRADLVLLAADPSADIGNLRRVDAVFRAGRRLPPPPRRD
jgi:hypothetical protein